LRVYWCTFLALVLETFKIRVYNLQHKVLVINMQSRNKIINKSTLCLFHTVCFTSHIVLGGTRGYCWMTPTEQAFSSLTSPQLPSPQTNLYRVYSLRIILYELKQTCDLIKYRNSIFPSFKVHSHYSVCKILESVCKFQKTSYTHNF